MAICAHPTEALLERGQGKSTCQEGPSTTDSPKHDDTLPSARVWLASRPVEWRCWGQLMVTRPNDVKEPKVSALCDLCVLSLMYMCVCVDVSCIPYMIYIRIIPCMYSRKLTQKNTKHRQFKAIAYYVTYHTHTQSILLYCQGSATCLCLLGFATACCDSRFWIARFALPNHSKSKWCLSMTQQHSLTSFFT